MIRGHIASEPATPRREASRIAWARGVIQDQQGKILQEICSVVGVADEQTDQPRKTRPLIEKLIPARTGWRRGRFFHETRVFQSGLFMPRQARASSAITSHSAHHLDASEARGAHVNHLGAIRGITLRLNQ
jgi:hypothetical protein